MCYTQYGSHMATIKKACSQKTTRTRSTGLQLIKSDRNKSKSKELGHEFCPRSNEAPTHLAHTIADMRLY